MTALYDLYDDSGRLLDMDKTAEELGQLLGIPKELIRYKAQANTQLLKRYVVKKAKLPVKLGRRNMAELQEALLDWETVTAVFRKVLWVKRMEPGVIRLKGLREADEQ